MEKSKYQKYCHCFIVCILVSYAFWFGYQQNIVTILMSAAFRGATFISEEALIRRKRLFQCGYPKMRLLFRNGAYLTPNTYQRKYSIYIISNDSSCQKKVFIAVEKSKLVRCADSSKEEKEAEGKKQGDCDEINVGSDEPIKLVCS